MGLDLLQGLKPLIPDTCNSQQQPCVLPVLNISSYEDSHYSPPSPVSELLDELSLDCSIIDTPDSAAITGKVDHQSDFLINGKGNEEELPSSFKSIHSSPVKQKPPAVSKKPKLSLISMFNSQPTSEKSAAQQMDSTTLLQTEDQVDARPTQRKEVEQEEEEEEEEVSESNEILTHFTDEFDVSASAFPYTSTDQGFCTDGLTPEEEEEEGDGTSSTSGSISSKEDDAGEVFESSTTETSPAPSSNGASEGKMVTPTPTRPRTTEDLFAAIHRSKRKVLGRRESEEDKSRAGSRPQSPPATPTSPAPGSVSSLPRQSGSIQRNLRKSTTSSDTFKALLLKKGSRSETSFRMSAAEMLRSTDPRFQRTRSESSLDPPNASPSSLTAPHSPSASPGRGKRASEEWSRYEALALSSPTSSPFSMGGFKYGRSRTPPSAASSKYNARSRILSSPMTVICEREGELAESEYGDVAESLSGPAAQTLPVLKDSNGTLSDESRS